MQNDVIGQYQQQDPATTIPFPFRLEIKKMWKPYAVAEILEMEIPKLKHGNDGLIFTPVADPYASGTCERLLKWKPSELNTVDFKLIIVPDAVDDKKYELHVASKNRHRLFDYHRPCEDLDLLDQQIIECKLVPQKEGTSHWEYIRVRKDKTMANNEHVVTKIINSINDNVTAGQLVERIPAIRRAWKARELESVERPQAKRIRS